METGMFLPKDITEGIGGSEEPFVGLPRRLFHSCLAPASPCLDNTPPPNTFTLAYHRRPHCVALPGLELVTQTYVGALELTQTCLSLLLECQDSRSVATVPSPQKVTLLGLSASALASGKTSLHPQLRAFRQAASAPGAT